MRVRVYINRDTLIGELGEMNSQQIETLAQTWYKENHGLQIPDGTMTYNTSSVSPDEETVSVLVCPPSRTFLMHYPFYLIETEFARNPLSTETTPIIIWINPRGQDVWDVLTYEWNNEDGIPHFRDHVFSNESLPKIFDVYPPTMEVRQRYSFLEHRKQDSSLTSITNVLDQLSFL